MTLSMRYVQMNGPMKWSMFAFDLYFNGKIPEYYLLFKFLSMKNETKILYGIIMFIRIHVFFPLLVKQTSMLSKFMCFLTLYFVLVLLSYSCVCFMFLIFYNPTNKRDPNRM